MARTGKGAPKKGLRKRMHRFGAAADNALLILREGRIGAPYRADFEVLLQEGILSLRRYLPSDEARGAAPPPVTEPILLVPPLMVTAEVYDISPELSAVGFLREQGLDVWVVDFGAPELAEGGWERTLDEHVLAVDRAIDHVREATGHPLHLCGYSQGGMFCYQAAALRRSRDLSSVIAMGSPVDMRRNLPVRIHDGVADGLLDVARSALGGTLDNLRGLPSTLTSYGFKLMSPRQEIKHLVSLLGLLHDRAALERVEPRRRFLGGEGFIAWPGPAFRKFVDDFVVHNRMLQGGFVVGGRTATLADIRCPVVYVVGTRDDFARPPSVRAIRKAVHDIELHEMKVHAGHFGLVVGSRAMGEVWPQVAQWVAWRSGQGGRPAFTREPAAEDTRADRSSESALPADTQAGGARLYDLATDVVDGLWHRLGEVSLDVTAVVRSMRWQLPRIARLASLRDDTRVNIGRALAEQAEAIGEAPFFLWKGQAYTYAEANRRVDGLVSALLAAGARPGARIGMLMGNHPDFLTVLAALSRLGAVAVVLNAEARGKGLRLALEAGGAEHLVADPDHMEAAAGMLPPGRLWVLGADTGPLPEGTRSLDAHFDPGATGPPEGIEANPGRASDLAMLLYTSGTTGMPKAAKITNRRWALAALGTAAACSLTPRDTVYCCLPLHHATGLLVSCSGALVGGARLALGDCRERAPSRAADPPVLRRFSTTVFWSDVRRSGATVVFYAGELCRYLVTAPRTPGERNHPVRLFCGNGMRSEVWRRLLERFGSPQVLEFYGSTEGNVVLANLTGEKIGSVGRPLMGQGDILLARWDREAEAIFRDERGRPLRCDDGEPGMLLARIESGHPMSGFEGYSEPHATEEAVLENLVQDGDRWFRTGDLLHRDEDGDYWFDDRVGDTFRWKGENVSTAQVTEVVMAAPYVAMAVVYGVRLPGREGRAGMAALELRPGTRFDGDDLFARAEADLPSAARPRFLRIVGRLETTASFKVLKLGLQREGSDPRRVRDPLYFYDARARRYAPLDTATWERLTEQEMP